MTATKAPSSYVSGHCGSGRHEACRGAYAGVACGCECEHRPLPPPAVLGDIAAALTDAATTAAVTPTRHCPTCACEDPR